jgi:serine protease inhibitor
MYIVLPDSITGIEKVVNEINPVLLKRALSMMDDTNVKLSMPKFKFNYLSKMVSALQQVDDEGSFNFVNRNENFNFVSIPVGH